MPLLLTPTLTTQLPFLKHMLPWNIIANNFLELSTAALTCLYFINVQNKPAEYEQMNIDEKRTWDLSRIKKIQKIPRNKLKGALEEAVHVLLSACGPVN